jgi:threonine aldolase
MNFASDNVYGVHPKILAALAEANAGTSAAYGYDDLTKRAEARLAQVFETELSAFLVTTGSAANGLALSALVPPYGAVFAQAEAHIAVDECNGAELHTGGAKIVGLPAPDGKLKVQQIERALKGFIKNEHDPKPSAISITNATEMGTVYSPSDVQALAEFAHARGMKLHMDGARFANALVGAKASAAEMTWQAGVDALSFGGTKNGGMLLEAVIFFDKRLAEDFKYRRMRSGQLVSKSRYLAAQMLAYLDGDLWLDNAAIANGLAAELAAGLAHVKSIRLRNPVDANEVFAIMPRALFDKLQKAGAHFYDWIADDLGDDEVLTRFVLSFATPKEDVGRLLELVERSA